VRWQGRRQSENVEDRRGVSVQRASIGAAPLLRLLPLLLRSRTGRYLLGGMVVVFVGAQFLGVDLSRLFLGGPAMQAPTSSRPIDPAQQELTEFVSVVLADTEDTWRSTFEQAGRRYEEPRLVLFSGAVRSACGFAEAAMGPFYCPADRKVYIDLAFYDDLKTRHGAPGDFAQAYVIAHEVGHHVQNLLGISEKVHSATRRMSQTEANALSVRLELQADCFAGFWGHHANRDRQMLEPGDLDEALRAASAIGDDRLQKQARGYVVPDSFTHGSSEQRVHWFSQGFKSGDMSRCDTFESPRL